MRSFSVMPKADCTGGMLPESAACPWNICWISERRSIVRKMAPIRFRSLHGLEPP